MTRDGPIGVRPGLTELVPYTTGAEVLLEPGVGQPPFKVDGPPVRPVARIHTVGRLVVEHGGHRAAGAV